MSTTLTNGVVASEHSDRFNVPPHNVRANLKVGSIAKVGINFDPVDQCSGERLWVRIVKVSGSGYWGRIDNHPLFTDCHGYYYDDLIFFDERNVLDVWQPQPEEAKR